MSHIIKVFIGNINKIKRGANMPDKNWQFELEEYIKQGEPDKAEKSEARQQPSVCRLLTG